MAAQRLRRVIAGLAVLLAVGLGYAAFVRATGLFLPCPVRALTGLQCPGCGVSHLCLALLRLDLAGAWAANPGLFPLLPPLALLLLRTARRYVRVGTPVTRGWETGLLWAMVIWLVIWGVVRNL